MPFTEFIDRAVPWRVIAASPDMMDVTPGSGTFPYTWRSSLAISVFEPPADEELDARLCGQRVSFVKVTCSITGYELRSGESSPVTHRRPLEELERMTSRYLGCYGALLNVAFFPLGAAHGSSVALDRLPHILDFSPKSRELVRGITEEGELLTGSSRELKFDDSRTLTQKNETKVEVKAEAKVKAGPAEAGVGGGVSHTWGTTDETKSGQKVETGESRQVKERYSTTMDQLYSLLTGYHTGTNRGTVIMLARPGTLEPTLHRTFVQGLRMIEGVQEFVFVVGRPADVEGLCIEAALDTGHFPEYSPMAVEPAPETREIRFTVPADAVGREGWHAVADNFGAELIIPGRPDHRFSLRTLTGSDEWVIDFERPGGWFRLEADRSGLRSPRGLPVPHDGILTHQGHTAIPTRLRAIDDASGEAYLVGAPMHARGTREGQNHRIDTIVDQDFIIYAKSRSRRAGPIDTANMLVTRRTLSGCYRVDAGCPRPAGNLEMPQIENSYFREIDTGLPQVGHVVPEALFSGMRRAMTNAAAEAGWAGPAATITETNYFAAAVAERLPSHLRAMSVASIVNVDGLPKLAQERLKKTMVGQILSVHSRDLARDMSLSADEIRDLRAQLLGGLEKMLRSPRDTGTANRLESPDKK